VLHKAPRASQSSGIEVLCESRRRAQGRTVE